MKEDNKKIRVIAFYLPQFHPIPENDKWWGKGFTEWTNVAKAKPLFKGHDQPRIPADLGFYDLRMPEIRERQAEMAREAGIEGFCYWHYWFGNGKQLLERPFNEVLQSGKPNFPFCLAWANVSWENKKWNKEGDNTLLIKQEYPGIEDYKNHFETLLSAFKDDRYIKVNGKLLFVVQKAADNQTEIPVFLKTWRMLAAEHNLDFYFVAIDSDSRAKKKYLGMGFDAICNSDILNIHHHLNFMKKVKLWILRSWFKCPSVFKYKNAIKYMIPDDCKNVDVIPTIAPNWDHSPRSGGHAMILVDSKPEYFGQLAKMAIDVVKDKPKEERLCFLKSWNEWGEGNYMEPDLRYGKGYINVLGEALDESK